MIDERLVLRLRGLQRSDARELADSVGAEATILPEESPPVGGYGDLGTRTVAVVVTARALRAVARYLAARQHSHGETVSLVVQIDDPDGTRREETLTYKAAAGQSMIEAAATALRALPGVGEALERSVW
jgi:alkylation response protein AidB-like acyl-CoA dehydrogenase